MEFDDNYLRDRGPLDDRKDWSLERWLRAWPDLKSAMDSHGPKVEREYQQLIVRDNNQGPVARATDYYICDIEYQHGKSRFDMIGMHWPSDSSSRQNANDRRLVFIEVKHGEDALHGPSGIRKHVEDINTFAREGPLEELKDDMVGVFNQKLQLGLIDCGKKLAEFSGERPMLLLAIANHDPGSSVLRRVLDNMPESPHVDVHVAVASMLGYGLFDQGIHPVDKARWRFDIVV